MVNDKYLIGSRRRKFFMPLAREIASSFPWPDEGPTVEELREVETRIFIACCETYKTVFGPKLLGQKLESTTTRNVATKAQETSGEGCSDVGAIPTCSTLREYFDTSGMPPMKRISLLRKAGCTCPTPLLGERPNVGPRCRLCNTVGKWE